MTGKSTSQLPTIRQVAGSSSDLSDIGFAATATKLLRSREQKTVVETNPVQEDPTGYCQ
jgi:hypothetical protein